MAVLAGHHLLFLLLWCLACGGLAAAPTDSCAAGGDCFSQDPDNDQSVLFQKKVKSASLGGGSGGANADFDPAARRTVTTGVGANWTCAGACGIMGGVPTNASKHCTCDIGPLHPPLRSVVQNDSALFWKSPFLMTHDSATGYVGNSDLLRFFVKTQYLDFLGQLDCGVRAFDLRTVAVFEDYRQIHFQHTSDSGYGWISRQEVSGTIPGIVDWCNQHPSELVVLIVSHCATCELMTEVHCTEWSGASCTDPQLIGAFSSVGAKVQTDCSTLDSWTLDEAKDFARLPGGGMLLMIPGEAYCVNPNYNADIKSIDQVKPYVEKTMAKYEGIPFQVQSIIQQSSTVPLSAQLNSDVYTWVSTTSLYHGVNFLEINLACAYGPLISQFLGATVTGLEIDQCAKICKTACEDQGACIQY